MVKITEDIKKSMFVVNFEHFISWAGTIVSFRM